MFRLYNIFFLAKLLPGKIVVAPLVLARVDSDEHYCVRTSQQETLFGDLAIQRDSSQLHRAQQSSSFPSVTWVCFLASAAIVFSSLASGCSYFSRWICWAIFLRKQSLHSIISSVLFISILGSM